jgi:hypothetical protein
MTFITIGVALADLLEQFPMSFAPRLKTPALFFI